MQASQRGDQPARLQIVAVLAATGAVVGAALSWLLSQILKFPCDFADSSRAHATG